MKKWVGAIALVVVLCGGGIAVWRNAKRSQGFADDASSTPSASTTGPTDGQAAHSPEWVEPLPPAPVPDRRAADVVEPWALMVRADDPTLGSPSARVTIVEFSDFECPFSARARASLRQVLQAYRGQVRVVWKNAPLAHHRNAMAAAVAGEAARQQRRFWQMHDRLFENQNALSANRYQEWAREVGMDASRFRTALQDPKSRARVEQDRALAQRLAIHATPVFYVNGERVSGIQRFEDLRDVVNRHLR